MERIVITNRQVKQVRQDGIVYIDNAGDEQFIDFELCYQNYLEQRLSSEGIESYKILNHKTDDDIPEHIERVKNWRAVADRNVLGADFMGGANSPPYFEFYAKPRIRIEFESRDFLDSMRNLIDLDFTGALPT